MPEGTEKSLCKLKQNGIEFEKFGISVTGEFVAHKTEFI
jgi:hypothetical protein